MNEEDNLKLEIGLLKQRIINIENYHKFDTKPIELGKAHHNDIYNKIAELKKTIDMVNNRIQIFIDDPSKERKHHCPNQKHCWNCKKTIEQDDKCWCEECLSVWLKENTPTPNLEDEIINEFNKGNDTDYQLIKKTPRVLVCFKCKEYIYTTMEKTIAFEKKHLKHPLQTVNKNELDDSYKRCDDL